ncbi:hypothetical protein KCP70_14770 [Salmonella enterica subsp. enterica]|nr:hypothetical protein KCP70_14770 [Salmonella enterica subsp. enterica]
MAALRSLKTAIDAPYYVTSRVAGHWPPVSAAGAYRRKAVTCNGLRSHRVQLKSIEGAGSAGDGANNVVNSRDPGSVKSTGGSVRSIINTVNVDPTGSPTEALTYGGNFHTVSGIEAAARTGVFTLIAGDRSISGSQPNAI